MVVITPAHLHRPQSDGVKWTDLASGAPAHLRAGKAIYRTLASQTDRQGIAIGLPNGDEMWVNRLRVPAD